MRLTRVTRITTTGVSETLEFVPGVNVLVGPPNAGKTKWLSTIDFVLGDSGTPDDALGADLAEKYVSASVTMHVRSATRALPSAPFVAADLRGDEVGGMAKDDLTDGPYRQERPETPPADALEAEYLIERRWKEPGARSKIFVDGDPLSPDAFSEFLLRALGVPLLNFPKGDPYAPRAWPSLSWRMLFRHIYRQERFWSDFADRQPPGEQHACLTQFLGIAESIFSAQFGELVERRKRILALQARKDAYMETLHHVTTDIGRFGELSVAITPESVSAARSRLTEERDQLSARRLTLLRGLADQVGTESVGSDGGNVTFDARSGALAVQRVLIEQLTLEASRIDQRTEELRQYHQSVSAELQRLDGAQAAGQALASLRVTHCPVCDQSVSPSRGSSHDCYLCFQPYNAAVEGTEIGAKRLAFEVEQLGAEANELEELLSQQARERQRVTVGLSEAQDQVARLDALLRPIRAAVAAVLPPDLSIFEQEMGRHEEQLRTLGSIDRALGLRDSLTGDIDLIATEVQRLEAEVSALTESVNFEQASDTLADGFNTYFNALNAGDPLRWPEGAARVRINGRQFSVTLDDDDWKPKLGATYACFFLNAYQYALLSLSGRKDFNYPGLAIIDFPPTLADDRELTHEENYLVEPFIDLATRLAPAGSQVIVAGRAFVDLEGAHRIELVEQWR